MGGCAVSVAVGMSSKLAQSEYSSVINPFNNPLLSPQLASGSDHGPRLAGGGLGFGRLQIQRGEGAHFQFLPVFDDQTLCQFDRLLLHQNIFPIVDEIEVSLFECRDDLHDLQAQGLFGVFQTIFLPREY